MRRSVILGGHRYARLILTGTGKNEGFVELDAYALPLLHSRCSGGLWFVPTAEVILRGERRNRLSPSIAFPYKCSLPLANFESRSHPSVILPFVLPTPAASGVGARRLNVLRIDAGIRMAPMVNFRRKCGVSCIARISSSVRRRRRRRTKQAVVRKKR